DDAMNSRDLEQEFALPILRQFVAARNLVRWVRCRESFGRMSQVRPSGPRGLGTLAFRNVKSIAVLSLATVLLIRPLPPVLAGDEAIRVYGVAPDEEPRPSGRDSGRHAHSTQLRINKKLSESPPPWVRILGELGRLSPIAEKIFRPAVPRDSEKST